MGNWKNMSWKARISAIVGALAVFGVSIGVLTEEEGQDATACVSAALANVDENYHPWLDEGCQGVAERLIQTIAADWGTERVESVLHPDSEEDLDEVEAEEDAVEEPADELEPTENNEG